MLKNRFWQVLFWSWALGVLILSVIPNQKIFVKQGSLDFDPHGYFQHFLAYGIGMYIGLKVNKNKTAMFIVLFGIFIEIIQYFLPYRSFNLFDILANLSGVIFILIIYSLFLKGEASKVSIKIRE